jgi:predicted nucleic acid-binding protein
MRSVLDLPTPLPVVLDTNVVLDWLVFRNPSCASLADALASGRTAWVSTAAMLDELAHVLGRGALAAWRPDADAIADSCRRWARLVEPQAGGVTMPRLRCTDPDDQKFIDLALQLGRNASLLSRDRAVLKLARRAREAGVAIVTPERWASCHQPLVPASPLAR